MPEQEIQISPSLTLTEIWTEEKTPQLKAIKVTSWYGPNGISSRIDVTDLSQVIEVLKRIDKDKKIQEGIKRRTRGET